MTIKAINRNKLLILSVASRRAGLIQSVLRPLSTVTLVLVGLCLFLVSESGVSAS
ncbi:hypothetical protein MNBD_GAMMA16-1873, partial [hydrothermal vent metagenome]